MSEKKEYQSGSGSQSGQKKEQRKSSGSTKSGSN